MFKPNYSITPDILNNLIKTAEAKALLDNAYLVPKWEVALRSERGQGHTFIFQLQDAEKPCPHVNGDMSDQR